MRILLISSFFHPHQGGSQKYMEELYRHLMDLDKTVSVDVICYNTDNSKKTEEYRGFCIYRIPCIQILPGQFALPNYFVLMKVLFKLTQEHKYEIIHSNTRFFDHSWWVPFMAKIIGAKSVLTDHCASHPVHPSRTITILAKIIDKSSSFIFLRFYDLITVTNNSTKRFISSLGNKTLELVYGGVDKNYYNPNKRQAIRKIKNIRMKFSRKDIIVTFLGRMIRTKGPHIFLGTALDLLNDYSNLHFILAGDGYELDSLRDKYKYKNIHFTGSLDKLNTSYLLANSDIFVHPSIHHEGFPNTILEAGASGCAVVATNNGGTEEIIISNKTGLLVDADERNIKKAIVSLINNISNRKYLAKNLRRKIESEYDWNLIAGNFLNLLKKIPTSSGIAKICFYKKSFFIFLIILRILFTFVLISHILTLGNK